MNEKLTELIWMSFKKPKNNQIQYQISCSKWNQVRWLHFSPVFSLPLDILWDKQPVSLYNESAVLALAKEWHSPVT